MHCPHCQSPGLQRMPKKVSLLSVLFGTEDEDDEEEEYIRAQCIICSRQHVIPAILWYD